MKKLSILFLFLLLMPVPFIAKADSTADYNAQYQVVQTKIQSIQSQYSTIFATASSQACLSSETGVQGAQCALAANESGAISEYEGALLKDFLTPVTSTSITYENQLDALQQQIFQDKMSYYQQAPGGGGNANVEENVYQNETNTVNAKITSLNQQIQTVLLQYQNALMTCPTNANYSNGQCVCNTGYLFVGSSCLNYDQACQAQYGSNATGDKNNCYCSSGYQWNDAKTQCVIIAPVSLGETSNPPTPTTTAIITPQPSQPTQTPTTQEKSDTVVTTETTVAKPANVSNNNPQKNILSSIWNFIKNIFKW